VRERGGVLERGRKGGIAESGRNNAEKRERNAQDVDGWRGEYRATTRNKKGSEETQRSSRFVFLIYKHAHGSFSVIFFSPLINGSLTCVGRLSVSLSLPAPDYNEGHMLRFD
jgi:hypothetical protein